MKINTCASCRSLALAVALLTLLPCVEPGFAQATKPEAPTNAPVKVRFRPRTTAAPAVRVSGGSRGTGDAAVQLDVLAPDDIGLTTQQQPSLFWYQSKPADARFELTLLQENRIKPLIQVSIERSVKAGIQRLRLSDHKVRLTPGVEYQWVVALIVDPDNRSSDLVSSGVIQCVDSTEDLRRDISQAPAASLPAIYAEAGIWYDALSTLSDQIDAQPNDQSLRETRADLISQVGLRVAAGSP